MSTGSPGRGGWTRHLEQSAQDLRFAVRTLARSPGFTVVALVTLALGIGANTAIFSVVNGVLLRPLDFPEPHRLFAVDEVGAAGQVMPTAWPNFMDWREGAGSTQGLAAWSASLYTLQGEGTTERIRGATVSEDFFPVLGVRPMLGRTLGPEEVHEGASQVAVISHGLWLRMFGGNAELDGLALRMGGSSLPIVGVMPPGFDYPTGTEAWLPFVQQSTQWSRSAHNWRVVGRLAPGASLPRAAGELSAISVRIREAHGDQANLVDASVRDLRETLVGNARRPLFILLGAAAFVLLVACCNLASTLMARSAGRRREVAIRSALGADRGRVVRQLLTESLLLTGGGALLGLALAVGLVRVILAIAPASLPRTGDVGIDLPVLFFTLVLTVVTALVFGLVPALRSADTDVRGALASGGRAGSAGGGPLAWNLLIGSEVALALVLLVGAGLLGRSFSHLVGVDPGFRAQGVLTAAITLPAAGRQVPMGDLQGWVDIEGEVLANWDRLIPAAASAPGVRRLGLVNHLPFSGQDQNGTFLVADDLPPLPADFARGIDALRTLMDDVMARIRAGDHSAGGNAGYRIVGGDYFDVMGIPLLEGRSFGPQDGEGSAPVAVINEAMARRFWPGESAVGKRFLTGGMDRWGAVPVTVTGVVGNVRHGGPTSDPYPEYFLHYRQRPMAGQSFFMVLEADGDPRGLVPGVRARLREAAPDVPATLTPMSERMAGRTAQERFSMSVLGGFAVLALTLAAVGIYGVVSYAVARRTREMGIRIALGAAPSTVQALVMRGALTWVVAGLGVGLTVALILGRSLESQLHGVTPRDPLTLLSVTTVLGLAAVLAALVPARRSTRVDPLITMKAE